MNAAIEVCGDWTVKAEGSDEKTAPVFFEVEPAPLCSVTDENCGALPVFNPAASGWQKGYRLAGVVTQETTAKGMLVPGSLRLRTSGPGARELVRGKDYEADLEWGTAGRLPDGTLGAEDSVRAAYSYAKSRLDSIVEAPGGGLSLRRGEPHVTHPLPPELNGGERRLANIWVMGGLAKLSGENLFPVLETCCPEPAKTKPPAEELIPKAYAKLRGGKRLRILAWGDSVTDASFLPHPATERWQAQFVARLREKFPAAGIELLTEAWPGRSTASYLAEPPGAQHNYQEKVLALKPDLIISEFVNDGGFQAQRVNEIYGKIAADFKAIGAEWIIITPHYVQPDWMKLDRQINIDDDPRACIKAIREFAARQRIAVADASKRWGRLWRQGLPYTTLLLNAINHPDPRGMRIFADSLMELF